MKMVINKRLLAVLIAISLLIVCSSCRPENIEVYMFENLAECEAITLGEFTNAHVTISDTPSGDDFLRDLAYTDFFASSYSSNEVSFDLFAYEFLNQDIAREYFQNVTGKTSDRTTTFSDVESMVHYRRIVIMDNMAYSIYTTPSESEKVIELINKCFSVEIIFS